MGAANVKGGSRRNVKGGSRRKARGARPTAKRRPSAKQQRNKLIARLRRLAGGRTAAFSNPAKARAQNALSLALRGASPTRVRAALRGTTG